MIDTKSISGWTGVKSTKELWEDNEATTGGKIDTMQTEVNGQLETSYGQ